MLYQNLKRTWSHNDANYIPGFHQAFPELSKVNGRELADRFRKLKMDFYTTEKTEIAGWIRLTLPFALILFVLMIIGLPFAFIITGKWRYSLGKNNIILNWFRALDITRN
jgi:hypothetical protein